MLTWPSTPQLPSALDLLLPSVWRTSWLFSNGFRWDFTAHTWPQLAWGTFWWSDNVRKQATKARKGSFWFPVSEGSALGQLAPFLLGLEQGRCLMVGGRCSPYVAQEWQGQGQGRETTCNHIGPSKTRRPSHRALSSSLGSSGSHFLWQYHQHWAFSEGHFPQTVTGCNSDP